MSHSLLNISMITKEAMLELKSQLTFASKVNRQYDDQFANKEGKIGAVANIRKPVRFAVTSGAAMSLQNVADQSVALTIDTQEHVAFQFSSKDLALSIEEFRARYIKPAITALANTIDYHGLQKYLDIPGSVGTPGTAPTSVVAALNAGAVLDMNGVPVDGERSIVLDPMTQAAIVGGSLTLFHSGDQVSKQYKKGRMGEAAGFDWYMDQNVVAHSTGAVDGSPQVKTSITAQGTTSVVIDTITTATITGAYKAGDVVTFGGVYALNPQTKVATSQLKQFVVTADANAASNEATISVSPAMYTTGNYANISAFPLDNALVKTFGGAASAYSSKVSPASLAFHKDAFALAMIDLPLPGGVDMAARASDPDAGLSVRIVRQYDINNDQFPCRIDVLYGWKTLYPELACRIQG